MGEWIRRAMSTPGSPFSSPSSSFSLRLYRPKSIVDDRNRPSPPNSGQRRSNLTVTDRFQVVTGWKQTQSMVTPDSGRSNSVNGWTVTYRPIQAVSISILAEITSAAAGDAPMIDQHRIDICSSES
ncbi:hypothetical protein GW17_00013076 [Ensete ventricosum]|nr:hypothetical protein GW17_00013076 [Ensete ventricosum]